MQRLVQSLGQSGARNLTVIPAGEIDSRSRILLCLNALRIDYLFVPPLDARRVGLIVRLVGKKANAQFDPEVIQELERRYEESNLDDRRAPFSLSHVHAICSLLVEDAIAGQGRLDRPALLAVIDEHLESLNRVITQFDILSSVEDLPLEEQRALVCRILRIVAEPGRTRIADYLRANLSELLRTRVPNIPARGGRNTNRATA